MLPSTFLHLPRVKEPTEQKLWLSGVHTWDHFLDKNKIKGFSQVKKEQCNTIINDSKKALHQGDSAFFLNLPTTAHWRLWPHFSEECLYVDIETNYHHDITVLGIYDGTTVKQFIKGKNLTRQAVQEHLNGKLFVTYNGASFDLPIIKRYFGNVIKPTPHFDTMHLARRLGYSGGLKKLEASLNIRRADEVVGMSGEDALQLWAAYRETGEEEYLTRLLKYNEEDIVNLATVAKKLVAQASEQLPKTVS